MVGIIDTVKLAESIQSWSDTPPSEPLSPTRDRASPDVEQARDAAIDFLQKQPEVIKVVVKKVVQIDAQEGSWEVEAMVCVPNPTIQALGLPVRKAVLDWVEYLVRLDGGLRVAAYGPRDSVELRGE